MRYYVEGSPTGPESFTKRAEAEAFAQDSATRFNVRTEVYDSTTHGRLSKYETPNDPSGPPFATFQPGGKRNR